MEKKKMFLKGTTENFDNGKKIQEITWEVSEIANNGKLDDAKRMVINCVPSDEDQAMIDLFENKERGIYFFPYFTTFNLDIKVGDKGRATLYRSNRFYDFEKFGDELTTEL